jgi:hypothetical protein
MEKKQTNHTTLLCHIQVLEWETDDNTMVC